MAGIEYTTRSVPISDKVLNGGLNSTAGALGLQNNESSDLQNIALGGCEPICQPLDLNLMMAKICDIQNQVNALVAGLL